MLKNIARQNIEKFEHKENTNKIRGDNIQVSMIICL